MKGIDMKKQKRLSINSATILDDNILYFAINNGNGLFSYNFSSEKLKFLGVFPGESKEQSDLYYTAVKYNNYLLFPPYHAEKFAVYDMENQEFTEWEFLLQVKSKEIVRTILYKDKLYLFGTWLDPYLLKADLIKKNIVFDETWMKEIYPEKGGEKYCRIETKNINQNGRNLFITVTTDSGAQVLCFDMEREIIDRITLPVLTSEFEIVSYSTAYGNKNYIWVIRNINGQIIELNRNTEDYAVYDVPIEEGTRINSYTRIFQGGQYLFLVPYIARQIIRIDTDTGVVNTLYCETEYEKNEYEDSWEKYSWSEYRDGLLYVFRTYTCTLKIFDTIEGGMKEIVFFDDSNVTAMYILFENSFYEGLTVNNSLEIYLDEINKNDREIIIQRENYGKRIYNQIASGPETS